MLSRPRFDSTIYKEMLKEINKKLGFPEDTRLTMMAFDGPCIPSKIEISIAHRLKMSVYTLAELAIVENMRCLGINSFIISQLTKGFNVDPAAQKPATEKLLNQVFSQELTENFSKFEEKHYINKFAMEQDYKSAVSLAYALREKFFTKASESNIWSTRMVLYKSIISVECGFR